MSNSISIIKCVSRTRWEARCKVRKGRMAGNQESTGHMSSVNGGRDTAAPISVSNRKENPIFKKFMEKDLFTQTANDNGTTDLLKLCRLVSAVIIYVVIFSRNTHRGRCAVATSIFFLSLSL